jgi:hypothetical protein
MHHVLDHNFFSDIEPCQYRSKEIKKLLCEWDVNVTVKVTTQVDAKCWFTPGNNAHFIIIYSVILKPVQNRWKEIIKLLREWDVNVTVEIISQVDAKCSFTPRHIAHFIIIFSVILKPVQYRSKEIKKLLCEWDVNVTVKKVTSWCLLLLHTWKHCALSHNLFSDTEVCSASLKRNQKSSVSEM